MSSHALSSPRTKDVTDEDQQPAEASVVGRSWVQSMFSRDPSRNTFRKPDGAPGSFNHYVIAYL